jgi:hypothetical protein
MVGKPEGKRPLESPTRRWVHNIKLDLGEVGRGDIDWNNLAQVREKWKSLVNVAIT